jgi:hypothetical protein
MRDTIQTKPGATSPARLTSVDAYRNFVMLAMASGAFALARTLPALSHGLLVKTQPSAKTNVGSATFVS